MSPIKPVNAGFEQKNAGEPKMYGSPAFFFARLDLRFDDGDDVRILHDEEFLSVDFHLRA